MREKKKLKLEKKKSSQKLQYRQTHNADDNYKKINWRFLLKIEVKDNNVEQAIRGS